MTTSDASLAPGQVELVFTYGECTGYCTTVLRVSGMRVSLTRVSDIDTDPDQVAAGGATEEWAARVREALASVSAERLEPIYGKPDSRDEGAATVRIIRDGDVSEHTYSATDPPPQLADLHALLAPVLEAWVNGEPIPGFDTEFPQPR